MRFSDGWQQNNGLRWRGVQVMLHQWWDNSTSSVWHETLQVTIQLFSFPASTIHTKLSQTPIRAPAYSPVLSSWFSSALTCSTSRSSGLSTRSRSSVILTCSLDMIYPWTHTICFYPDHNKALLSVTKVIGSIPALNLSLSKILKAEAAPEAASSECECGFLMSIGHPVCPLSPVCERESEQGDVNELK